MTPRILALALGVIVAVTPLQPLPAGAAATLESEPKVLQSASGVRIEAERGRLLVPENRAKPGSRSIAVGFLRLKSKSAAPKAPRFYLEGGPGSRGVSESPRALDYWLPYLDVGDVVLIDQRGTNDSSVVWRWDGPPPLSYYLHPDSARRHIAAMNRRAAAVFRERGVDLAGYTTVENADDLDDLRVALGARKVSILGFSYGTHLGIAYLRRHGANVENAVLLGTEGPDETYKLPWTMDVQFAKLALLARADPAISARIPDLVALYDSAVVRLAREPLRIPLAAPGGGGTISLPIGPFGLRSMMRPDIGDASDLPVVPRLLWSVAHGDTTELAWFVRKRAGGGLGVHAMNQAMDVVSGASPARLALIGEQARTSRFADVINFPHPTATSEWGLTDLGDGFRAPLVSPVRTLFISGELDLNTPPYQAEEVRWGMPNSTHLIVANAGHEQTFFQNDTSGPVIVDFLKGMDVSARRITYPPLRFVPLEGPPASGGPSHPSVRR